MVETTPGRRRGRAVLFGFVAAAVLLTVGPPLLRGRLARDLCPSEITGRGSSDGVVWETSRADCGAGRLVLQLRIVPPKGVSTLVYSTEDGPAPIGWTQTGLVGTLHLAAPLDGRDEIAVPLDPKGRPLEPIDLSQQRKNR